jgi:hypothetical protein
LGNARTSLKLISLAMALVGGCGAPPGHTPMSLAETSALQCIRTADAHASSGHQSEALELALRANDLVQDRPDILWRISVSAAGCGQVDCSRAALNRLLGLYPESATNSSVRQLCALLDELSKPTN